MVKEVLMVGVGGFVGSVLRFVVSTAMKTVGKGFPVGTFVVNIAGCFLIGLFYSLLSRSSGSSSNISLLLTTGFCGGFTTFSTFSKEGLSMLQNGDYLMFVLYVCGSVLLGLTAAWCGMAVGK